MIYKPFKLKNWILDLLFPPICSGCKSEGEFLCVFCRDSLRFIPPSCFGCGKLSPGTQKIPAGRTCMPCRKENPIYGFLSPLSYRNETISGLIHSLKYQKVQAISIQLAELLNAYLKYFNQKFPADSIIIPVPLHPARERTRGFNQSVLIAGHLSDLLDIPVHTGILLRAKNTRPQIEFHKETRLTNMLGAFTLNSADIIKDKTIILLDDVKTTGATLKEAASTLKSGGAKRIWALTVAH